MTAFHRAFRPPALLLWLAAIYCVASLAHFVHNAEYLAQYPNMPVWLSRSKVYASWLVISAIGAVGLLLTRSRYAVLGLLLVAIYAGLGFDGLEHYTLAPMSAHSFAMNATIWCEVVAAALLLAATLRCLWIALQEGFRKADA